MNTEDEMIKYVRPSYIDMFLLTPFSFVVSAIVAGGAVYKIIIGEDVYLFLIVLCVGMFMMWFSISSFRDYRKMTKFFTDSGIYHEAAADFISAQSFMKDRMRMGDKYIFCRRLCTVIRYQDICRVYQDSFEDNLTERARELKAADTSGRVWRLCGLKPNTDNQPGLREALDFMLSKNNLITIES